MKHLHFFFVFLFFFFSSFTFSTRVTALNLEDLSTYSKVKSYCEIKNINNIPLSIKIEQMLFLNWNFNKLNQTEVLDYIKNHYIGGISLSVNNLENNQQKLKNFTTSIKNLYNLPYFYTIPYFIKINSNDFLTTEFELKDQKNIQIIHSLGANIINIDAEIKPSINNAKNYRTLLDYLKKSNNKGVIVSINKFKDPFSNKREVNIYGWLIKKGRFDQIIIPENYMEPKIDKYNYYSLSKIALEENIKNNLRFNGILLNTSLASSTIKDKYTINQIIINAITSGNNMLYYDGGTLENNKKFVEDAINIITKATNAGIISIEDINKSYIKIINLKTQFHIIPRKNYC